MPSPDLRIIEASHENSLIKPGEIREFFSGLGDPRLDLTEVAFNQAHRIFIARSGEKLVGAVRASFDGVYAMIHDLKIDKGLLNQYGGLKSELLGAIVNDLNRTNHPFIAAIVPEEEAEFYRSKGLSYGDHLTVVEINPDGFHPRDSEFKAIQNGRVSIEEIRELFEAVRWEDEANMAAQFTDAFNNALCNFTVRDSSGKLIGMQRVNFDGKIAMRWNLVVHPEYQSRHIGSMLLSNIIRYVKSEVIDKGYLSYGLALNRHLEAYGKIGLKKSSGLVVATNSPNL